MKQFFIILALIALLIDIRPITMTFFPATLRRPRPIGWMGGSLSMNPLNNRIGGVIFINLEW